MHDIVRNSHDLSFFSDLEKEYPNITVYRFLELQKNSYITFIKDEITGKNYLVKQEKSSTLERQFQVVFEKLAAHMAFVTGIPAHQVIIIPAGVSFPGKNFIERTATLHTVVPGITLRQLTDGYYSKLDLKQNNNKELSFDELGLNKRLISFMALHEDLSAIVALDTFIGNNDRNKANVLYDQNNDHFYAIDMSSLYNVGNGNKRISFLACEHIEFMLTCQLPLFSREEKEALKNYSRILETLVQKFPPSKIYRLIRKFMEEAHLTDMQYFDIKEVNSFFDKYKIVIRESYLDNKRLLYLLDHIINKS